ncbi:MAG: extracellular solute-binding protein [Pelolinea sp.]|nr:extracellular solute-binding protein [Pelolinea sp.]
MCKRKLQMYFGILVIGSILLAACAPATTPAPAAPAAAEEAEKPAEQPAAAAPAATGEIDWKQVAGTKLTVYLSETPMALAIRNKIDEFKEKTDIDLEYLVVSEGDYWNKLTIDLTSGSNQFNVFMSGPTINWGYANAQQIQPLDPFLKDPTLTPADWNVADFYPWALDSNRWDGTPGPAGLGKGDLWCIPIDAVEALLTYRKDIFDKYGLKAPDTWDEWAATAKKLQELTGGEVDGQPFYPVVQRGSLDATALSGPFYGGLFSYGGLDFNDDLTPAMNSPKSVAFQKLYMDTLKNYGSSEWPSMMWPDVQQGFTTGQYGMVVDVGDFIPVYEGEGSKVAGKLAYARPPAGEGGRFSSVWTWGLSMNAKTTGDQAKAAWLFIMWASSKEAMTSFAKTGSWPTRLSVWESPEVAEFSGKFGNGTFREAFGETMDKDVAWLVAPMVDSWGVETMWLKGLHDYWFGKGDMQTIMDQIAADITVVLKDSGTIK